MCQPSREIDSDEDTPPVQVSCLIVGSGSHISIISKQNEKLQQLLMFSQVMSQSRSVFNHPLSAMTHLSSNGKKILPNYVFGEQLERSAGLFALRHSFSKQSSQLFTFHSTGWKQTQGNLRESSAELEANTSPNVFSLVFAVNKKLLTYA